MIDKQESPEIFDDEYYHEYEDDDPIPKFEIFSYPQDTSLAGYVQLWEDGDLFIPEFQRKYIWEPKRASKLIESFTLGVPVPSIFLYKKQNDRRYWIIDGQQRIKTVLSFLTGKPVKGNLSNNRNENEGGSEAMIRLTGLKNKRLKDKTFKELDEQIQSVIKKTVLRAIIVNQVDSKDDESLYYIFERLNTGGMLLSPMEIRMCVSHGSFAFFLENLNNDDNWRSITKQKNPNKRCRDIEWILRIFALHDNLAGYKPAMKKFLDKYMQNNASADEMWLEEKQKLFKYAIEKSLLLPDTRFKINGKFNLSCFDSILIALMHSCNRDFTQNEMIEVYNSLTHEDSDYSKIITKGRSTDAADTVKNRINLARKAFEKI